MKKTLAIINGIVGLVVGIFLIIGGPILFFAGMADAAVNIASSSSEPTFFGVGIVATLFMILKLIVLALGVVGLVLHKGDERVGVAPNILLVVGGILSIIPLLGWIGGIIIIVGGAMFLSKLKNFK